MKKKLCAMILRSLGWKTRMGVELPDKCVFCVAPHTSNWDLFLCELLYFAAGGKHRASFFIKKEWFFFPLGYLFRWMGGIAVDRSKKTSLVSQIIAEFDSHDFFQLAVTPEATRQANPNWKRGFYYIAKGANVPILLVYLDYPKKEMGVEQIFEMTDNEDADIQTIKDYFSQFKGLYPDKFSI